MAHTTDFHGYGNKIRSEILSRIPKNRRNLKVLDVGTGFGSTVTFLAERLPKGSKVWTVDPSEEILANARAKLQPIMSGKPRVEVEFVLARAQELRFEDDFFDVVVSVMVLHHLEGLGDVFAQLFRVLKKGGKMILTDYRPEAGKELEFQKRHAPSDFFTAENAKAELLKSGNFSQVKVKRFKMWYLVDATK